MSAVSFGRLWIVFVVLATTVGATSPDGRLIEAVKQGDTATVRALLKQGVDVNTRAGDGSTALHWAAYRDDQDTADLLIRTGGAVNAANDLGVTPLWVACTTGSRVMIARLLKAGANPNVAPSTGGTPLMLAARSRAASADAVKSLLEHGADVNAKEGSHGQTALMWAVAEEHSEVVRVLLDFGADVHARSRAWRELVVTCCTQFNGDAEGQVEIEQGGFTPLLFGARQGDVASAKLLLAAGANVNDTAAVGTTALVVAAHSGHGAFAALLLDQGADPNAAGAGYTALHAAVLRSDLDLVQALLAHGANPNARLMNGTPSRRVAPDFALDKALVGATPFLLAAKFLEPDLMRVLATNGADTRAALPDGTTPLMAAALGEGGRSSRSGGRQGLQSRALDVVTLAVALGGDVNGANEDGDTALHMAASKKLDAVIQFLADRGATLAVKNKKGQTPLAIALLGRQLPKGAFTLTSDILASVNANGRNSTAELLSKLGAKE